MSSGNDFEMELFDTYRSDMKHQERHTATFVQWGRGLEWKTLRRKKRRFCARLVIFRRHFRVITIVLICAFYSSLLCNSRQYYVHFWNIYLHVLKCLIKVEVVKGHFSKDLVIIHIKCYFGNDQTTSLNSAPCICAWFRREGSAKSSLPCVSKWGAIDHCPLCSCTLFYLAVYIVYIMNGQVSPDLQHLVFLDVKRGCQCMTKIELVN